jgi:hypothetical protein
MFQYAQTMPITVVLILLCVNSFQPEVMKNIPHFGETILRYAGMPGMKCHLAILIRIGYLSGNAMPYFSIR